MIRNICANWASVGINLVVAFVMSPFLVHALGDSRYGLWVLVLSVTGYMGLLDSGLRVSIVKHTAERNARGDVDGLNRILFTALSLYGSLGAVVVLASFVSSFFFEHIFAVAPADVPVGRVLTVIAGLNVALSLPLGVFGSLLAGLQRYDRLTSSGIIVLLLRTIAIVVAVKSGMGLITLGWIHVASQLLSGAILFHMAARAFPQLSLYPRRLERATMRVLYNYSGFILLNNVATFLLFYSGEVLIGMFIGAAEVTVYAIARSLVQYLSTIIGSMAQVFHPYASDQHARGNPGAVLDALIMGTKSSLLIALPIGVAFVIVGPTFIGLWMGAEYGRSAGLLLAWLTVPQIVWLSQSTATNILLGVGRHRTIAMLNVVTGLAAILGSVALVPVFGSVGVAAGAAVPILISSGLILPVLTARAVNIGLKDFVVEAYLGPLTAVLPFTTVLFVMSRLWLPDHLAAFALQLLVSLCVFFPAAYFLAFNQAERERWLARLRPSRRLASELP
jgi:O-antigen/teichoic acid export membrane protein